MQSAGFDLLSDSSKLSQLANRNAIVRHIAAS